MVQRWLRLSTAALALAGLLAALTAGCGSKPEAAAPGAPPTAEQAQAQKEAGDRARAGAESQGAAAAAQHH